MIETIQNAIIVELSDITGIGTVDAWQGDVNDIEEILQMPQKLPALHVIYHGAAFDDKRTIGADTTAAGKMRWMVISVNRSLKSRKDGAESSYTVIEAVRGTLKGLKIPPYPGFLWPVQEDLLMALGGLQVYGLIFRMNTSEIA